MAKGIIVIDDIPVICAECSFANLTQNKQYFHCDAKNRTVYNAKPDWCPIMPVYSDDTDSVNVDKESVILSPKDMIELLERTPEDDILMVEINGGNDESGVVTDVCVGVGTAKGFTYIKVSTDI